MGHSQKICWLKLHEEMYVEFTGTRELIQTWLELSVFLPALI